MELVRSAWQPLLPSRVIAWGAPEPVPLLHDRPLLDGRPAAYVCEHFSCLRPVAEPEELAQLLA